MRKAKLDDSSLHSGGNGAAPQPAGFREYGADSIRRALVKMLSHAEDVRQATDDEAVHDMRVASRRLRAAIAVFEPAFRGKRYGRFRIHVKRLTDALSHARDLDVMIGAVKKLCGEIPPPERLGVDDFRDHLVGRRANLQKEVRKSLKALESSDLVGEFARIADAPEANGKEPSSAHGDLEEEFYDAVSNRVDELVSWEPFIHDNRRVFELHQMRIAAKRLRYTMELFAPYRGPLFSSAIDQVRKIQEHLGKIHDADVIGPALLVYLRSKLCKVDELDKDGVYAVESAHLNGLLMAAMTKQKEREDQYEKFLADWEGIKKSALLEHIVDMARSSSPTLPEPAATRR